MGHRAGIEGVRIALRDYGAPLTGDKVRKGRVAITPQDHEGGGYLRVYQVKGNACVPQSGWIRGYRDDVMALVRKANNR